MLYSEDNVRRGIGAITAQFCKDQSPNELRVQYIRNFNAAVLIEVVRNYNHSIHKYNHLDYSSQIMNKK